MSKAAEAKAYEAAQDLAGSSSAPQYREIQAPLEVQDPDYSKGGWLVHTAAGSKDRLIIDFEHITWCGSASGLLQTTLPPQLAAKGVKEADWNRFCRACSDIMSKRWTVTSDLFAVLFLIGIPCLIGSETSLKKKLAAWQRALNEEVLEPVGCYAKLQMVSDTIQTSQNSSYTEERSWLAVALTPEESEKLRREEVFWTTECCGDRLVPAGCGNTGDRNCCGAPCVI